MNERVISLYPASTAGYEWEPENSQILSDRGAHGSVRLEGERWC